MSIRGSIKTMPIVDLLDWIDRRELKGTMAFERVGVTRKVHVAYGCVTETASNNPAEFLGQLLINAGCLDEEQLRTAYDARGETGSSLGKTLLTRKIVDEEALRDALETKARESIYDLLSWTDGTFAFDPEEGSGERESALFEIAIPLRDAMVTGADRAEKWKLLRAAIPGDGQRFWLPDRSVLERLDPASPRARLLACVTRDMTVRDIMLHNHALPYPIYEELAELLGDGVIRLDRRAKPRSPGGTIEPDPELLMTAARGRSAGGDRYGALALARQALDASPEDERARRTYQDVERALFAELSRSLLTRYRVPRLVKQPEELAALDLTPEERYFVGRIDGRWDLLSLMRVSPLREAEALITLQRLAQRGLITLE